MNPADWSNAVYGFFFVGISAIYGVWRAFRHTIKTLIAESLAPICEDIQKIKHQVYNNGGESMKDAIDRIEKDAIELKINQAVIKAKLEAQ